LSALDQQKVLKTIAEGKWNELSRLVPHPREVQNFLQNLSSYSYKETNRPTAPYIPGVTGFAINERGSGSLLGSGSWEHDKVFDPLVNVLSTCLSYNLLERIETKQGSKNQKWTVYYLNRWLCLHFNLPLGYGGWRHKTPSELLKWTK